MQGLTSEPAPAEPEQTTEEVVEEPTEDNIPVEDVEQVEVAEATDDAEQDINESSEEPSYTVKVDGSEMEVTLDELLRGYQREADYTRKTSELSLEKSKYNDLMQQSQSEINNKLSKLEELTTVAQQELQQEYSRIDFEKLYEEDPSEAARLEHKMRKRAENLAMIQEETKANQQQEFQKYLQEQQHKVSTLVPEFNDPAKASKLKSDMRVYLSKLGYGEKDINSIYDARQVLLIRDAMAYDALKKSNAKVTKKVANAPKVVKSGIAKNKTDASSKLRRDKLNRLKKTGAAKDAASIFKDYL
jgi:UDP-N-acetylglucosamine transferase subunit ALG13